MKNYASRAHKGKVAFRTPSRVLAGRPEAFKRQPPPQFNKWELKNRTFGK